MPASGHPSRPWTSHGLPVVTPGMPLAVQRGALGGPRDVMRSAHGLLGRTHVSLMGLNSYHLETAGEPTPYRRRLSPFSHDRCYSHIINVPRTPL